MAKLALLAVLVVVLVARMVQLDRHSRFVSARRAELASAELTQGVTLGQLRAMMGAPRAMEDGYQWDDFGVRVYTFKHEDEVVPYLVTAVRDFPGLVKRVRVGSPCSAVLGAHEQNSWFPDSRELGSAGPGKVWLLSWAESDHVVTQMTLARVVKAENVTFGSYCPQGYANYFVTGKMTLDADGSPQ